MKRSNFLQIRNVTSSNFIYNLETFRGFYQVHLLQIEHDNNFLPTSKHQQAKVRRFLGIC